MMAENGELRLELHRLLEEVMQHSKATCGGIPEAAELLASVPEFPSLPQGSSLTDLEQTLAGFPPAMAYQLASPPIPASGTNYVLDKLSLDEATPHEMMDMILAGEI